jgi:hypothetical protein
MGIFRTLCSEIRMSKLHWPAREYIVQVARFDPAKGIPVVIGESCSSLGGTRQVLIANSH